MQIAWRHAMAGLRADAERYGRSFEAASRHFWQGWLRSLERHADTLRRSA